jgi:hypothetical protein
MEKAIFTAEASIIEVPNPDKGSLNPYLTLAKFVFADDKGNSNSQGIEFEDFDEVANTALHMPVKMNFTGTDVQNHLGSYVVGHITEMEKSVAEDNTNQLMATAVLYREEYPEEVRFLKDAHASGDAPGISYEIAYEDSIIRDGVQWLKKLVTCAATFVKTPAYGKRTALLALASAKTDSEFKETLLALAVQAEETVNPTPTNKGGNKVDELEKAKADLDTAKAEAETKTAEINRLVEELNSRDETISTLQESIANLEREKTLEARSRKMTEAGFALEADAEKADKKKEFWLSLSEEAFEEYVNDLIAAKSMAPKTAEASHRGVPQNSGIPRPEVPAESTGAVSFRFRE